MKKSFKIATLVLIALLLVTVIGFLVWAAFPLGPGQASLNALSSSSSVTVEITPDWIIFQPLGEKTTTGLIFYPGGRVDYRSYAPLLEPLAEQGYFVVLARMPLSLAVFSPAKADEVIQSFTGIQHWVIGGHSLGGAMASSYIYRNPGNVEGLVLWASYPVPGESLADQAIKAVSIYGSEDGEVETIEASSTLLPAGTTFVRIDGGNHAQFGDYGEQPGDGVVQISAREQQEQVIAATLEFLEDIRK